ncbi:MAG: glycerophosphoryl diester phosphodiesterase membrane domain-containing protein [Bacteroidota bacterium]
MNTFDFNKTRDGGEIIGDTFAYIRLHFSSLGKALLFFVFPFQLIGLFLAQDSIGFNFAQIFNPETVDQISEFFGWQYLAGLLLSTAGSMAMVAVTVRHMYIVRMGEEPTLAHLAQGLIGTSFGIWGLSLIVGFIIFFGLLLFFIPGVYLGVKLILANSAYIMEDESVGDAMSSSWEVTKDYWWDTFLIVIVMYILVVVAAVIVTVPTSIGTLVLSNAGVLESTAWATPLVNGVASLLGAIGNLFYVILYISFTLQYLNLKERKEGGGLRAKIEALGR